MKKNLFAWQRFEHCMLLVGVVLAVTYTRTPTALPLPGWIALQCVLTFLLWVIWVLIIVIVRRHR